MFPIFFIVFCVSSIIFGPIFYFVPTKKQQSYNLFFLVIMVLSFLTMLGISPFLEIKAMLVLMFFTLLSAGVSSAGFLFSKVSFEKDSNAILHEESLV